MMSEGLMDVAADVCSNDSGRPTLWRLVIKLVIVYAILAMISLAESRFRAQGIELQANVETIGRNLKGELLVRYHFRDPVTGLTRMNTVTVPEHLAPRGLVATIEYIPCEYPSSRLKGQARPEIASVFFWVNVVLLSSIASLIGYIIWEMHHPIPRSSQRINGRYRVGTKVASWQ